MTTTNTTEHTAIIETVEEIVGHRIEEPAVKGGWIVWCCNKSSQTMAKFVERVKRETRRPVFCREGKFGVKA